MARVYLNKGVKALKPAQLMMMSSQHQGYMAVHKASVEIALHQIYRANCRAQFHHSAFFTIASLDAMFFKCNTQSQYFASTCVRRTFFLVCSVRTFLFAACGFFCLQRADLFCLQRADFFVCSVRTFLFAACGFILFAACEFFICSVRIYFVRSGRIYLVCSVFYFVRCVTSCYMEEYYQERCVPCGLPYPSMLKE